MAKRSPGAAADLRHALAADAQRRAGLRALGDLDGLLTVERRHENLAAERERREVHRHFAEQIDAVAPEELVLLHVHDDVEMSGGTAADARLAFALQAQLLTGGDAGGNLDRDLPLLRDAARAMAGLDTASRSSCRRRGTAGRCAPR